MATLKIAEEYEPLAIRAANRIRGQVTEPLGRLSPWEMPTEDVRFCAARRHELMTGGNQMELEDETIGLRRRLAQLQSISCHVDDPFAVALLKEVVADIERRIAAVEAASRLGLAISSHQTLCRPIFAVRGRSGLGGAEGGR